MDGIRPSTQERARAVPLVDRLRLAGGAAIVGAAILAGSCAPQASVPPYRSLDPDATGALGPAISPVGAPTTGATAVP